MRQLKPTLQIALLAGAAVAAQTAVTSSTMDTTSGDSFAALVNVGSVAAGGTLQVKLQGGQANDGSDKADINGAVLNLTATDANKAVLLEIHRPPTPFITVSITRATANSDIVSVQGFVFGGYNEPVAQPGITQSLALVSPTVLGAAPQQ